MATGLAHFYYTKIRIARVERKERLSVPMEKWNKDISPAKAILTAFTIQLFLILQLQITRNLLAVQFFCIFVVKTEDLHDLTRYTFGVVYERSAHI